MKRIARLTMLPLMIWGMLHKPLLAAAQEFVVAEPHRILAHHSGWLNTSRPLVAEDFKGRVILLDFWTFCCINCMHVIPDLQALEKQFGDKLTVIGVHSAKFRNEQDSENIRQAILRYGIAHPVVNDFDFSVWKSFDIHAWPSFLLISPEGKVVKSYSGEGNREEMARDIAVVISQFKDRANESKLPIALEKEKEPQTVLRFPGKVIHVADMPGGEALVVSDSGHNKIAVLNLDGTVRETIGSGAEGRKDGAFAEAEFHSPQGMAGTDGVLYVADTENHLLRAVDFIQKSVSTLAGTGKQGFERKAKEKPALSTPLASPWDVAFYPDRDHLVIAMAGTHQLWSYDVKEKTLSVIAGNGRESIDDGAYPYNYLSQPSGLSALGDKLYFVDAETSSLRVLSGGKVTTLIGTGLFDFGYREGVQGAARMQHPLGLFADDSGVYVADSYNHSIRRYDPATGILHNFAGKGARGKDDGSALSASFNEPNAIARVGDALFVTDTNNHRLRRIGLSDAAVTTLEAPTGEAVQLAAAGDLPNIKPLPAQGLLPGKPAALMLSLKDGWKINHEAPSYVALFEAGSSNAKPVAHFDRPALEEGKMMLPPLESGKEYRLQGTLYYCEKAEGSICEIASFDVEVKAAGGKSQIVLPLN